MPERIRNNKTKPKQQIKMNSCILSLYLYESLSQCSKDMPLFLEFRLKKKLPKFTGATRLLIQKNTAHLSLEKLHHFPVLYLIIY